MLGIFHLSAVPAFAEADDEGKGKMRLRTDRISEEKSDDYDLTETELEKQLPDLFKNKTMETIEAIKTSEEESLKKLEDALFNMPSEADVTLKELKKDLFTDDYMAPKRMQATEDQEQEGSSPMKKGFFVGFLSLAVALCGGIYAMFMKFS